MHIMNIGAKITTLRKDKNWSQTELSKQVGVSREIIGRYERNEVLPSIEVAKKIADAFDVSLDYLVNKTEQDNIYKDQKMIKRLQDILNLPEKERECLLMNIDHFIKASKINLI